MLKRFYAYLQRNAVSKAEMRVDIAIAELDEAYKVFCRLYDEIIYGDSSDSSLLRQVMEARADYIRKAEVAYEARKNLTYIKGEA